MSEVGSIHAENVVPEEEFAGLKFNNPSSISENKWAETFSDMANHFNFNDTKVNWLNLCIAASAAGTSPAATYGIRFAGLDEDVPVSEITAFLNVKGESYRKFMRGIWKWYNVQWQHRQALIVANGGRHPDSCDFEPSITYSKEESLYRKSVVQQTVSLANSSRSKPPRRKASFGDFE